MFKKVKEKFSELKTWQKVAVAFGAFAVVAALLYFGVDPEFDFKALND